MKYFYLDESGDLGFSKGSSECFVIAIITVDGVKSLKKKVKKNVATLINRGWPSNEELKAYSLWGSPYSKSIPNIIGENNAKHMCSCLENICEADLTINYIAVRKRCLTDRLKSADNSILYNFFTYKLLIEMNNKQLLNDDIDFTVDRRSKETHKQMPFDGYISTQIVTELKHQNNLEIKHCDSNAVNGLQAVDFICWSIFRKHEHGDDRFYNLISPKFKAVKRWYI